jgi:hypothetical protein
MSSWLHGNANHNKKVRHKQCIAMPCNECVGEMTNPLCVISFCFLTCYFATFKSRLFHRCASFVVGAMPSSSSNSNSSECCACNAGWHLHFLVWHHPQLVPCVLLPTRSFQICGYLCGLL